MFTITRNGLDAISKDLGVISNNIANAGTNGFKRSRTEFVDFYSKALSDSPNNKVGLGSLFQGSQKIMQQGSPIMTNGALDLNISGRGFFILSPKIGAEPRFTRDGSFSLDSSGNLITTDGFNVAGYRRDELEGLIKTSAEPINIPLSIENKEGRTVSLTGINVDAYGNIETTYGLNDIVKRDQIALAKFNNDTELKSVGSNAFQASDKSGLQVLGSPLESNFGEILSGTLESSNTNITNEMISMIRTQQAFNGNARILQTSVDITRRLMG